MIPVLEYLLSCNFQDVFAPLVAYYSHPASYKDSTLLEQPKEIELQVHLANSAIQSIILKRCPFTPLFSMRN